MSASHFFASTTHDRPIIGDTSLRDRPIVPAYRLSARVAVAFPSILLLVVILLSAPFARAQSGLLLRTFSIRAEKLLLDPNRPRLYVTMPEDNSIGVIDTDSNSVVTTFSIHQKPLALVISPDGTRLYVANSSTTTNAVTVVDLTTLTVLTNLPAPFTITAIAAGMGNRLYVLAASANPNSVNVAQLDATTGELQTTFDSGTTQNTGGYLQISPDLTTLYVASLGNSPSTLTKYDVSTATPGDPQAFPGGRLGYGGKNLVLSHDGENFVFPTSADTVPYGVAQTLLYSTANFGTYFGAFVIGTSIGPTAFSQDDTLFVETQAVGGRGEASIFKIFDRATFTLLDWFLDPDPAASNESEAGVRDMVLTSPNGYLYYSKTSDYSNTSLSYLRMVGTRVPPFFDGAATLDRGYHYLNFADGVPFGYYNLDIQPYLYHLDLGFEYPIDAADGQDGLYLYDFSSSTFWYTSSSLFPYLYDFKLNTFLYYYPDPGRPGHYNTNGVRYFYNFATGKIISK